ncbi:MAG: hypothetical protein SH817_06040 [Leptospira sp.]|nr:hypothetical protein [Leptospira sp.]
MNNLTYNKLNINVNVEDQNNLVRIIWSGTSDDISPGKILTPYLSNIADEIGGRKLSIELYDLEFMNSSTVPPIVQFIKYCSQKNIDILILYSSSKEWQKFSFKSFETFAIVYKNLKISAI